MKQTDITLDRYIYPRENMNGATVEAYETSIEAGAKFPEIEIQAVNNYDNDNLEKVFHLIVDGAHRWQAVGKGGELEVVHWKKEVLDYQKNKVALLLRSHELNSVNAKNLTNDDKKATARKIAEDAESFTDQAIADKLGVPQQTVNDWVKDIRARKNAGRDAIIFRLSRLGWTQEEIGEVVELDRSVISKIVQNTDFGKLHIPPNSTIEKVAKDHCLDLVSAYTMLYGELPDAELLTKVNIKTQPYDVWNFSRSNKMFGLDYPGRIPAELIAHVLYFFTKRGDTILDPMAGGGTTQDVCLLMGRKCFAYDIDPNIDRVDYREWDLRDGWPDKTTKADLIFCDPPYYKKKDYHKGSISNESVEEYVEFMRATFFQLKEMSKKGATLAFLMSDWDDPDGGEGIFIWDYTNLIDYAGWKLERHIQVPLPTQQVHPDIVNKFRESRRLARLERYLLIAKNV